MAGTVAAVFGDSIFDLLELGERQLTILCNEAERQRWLQAATERRAHYDKNFNSSFSQVLKIHGQYTKNFHKKELDKLKGKIGNGLRVSSTSQSGNR